MKYFIFILLLLIGFSASAQNSFFKPEAKPKFATTVGKGITATVQTITQNVVRPIANIASYATPNNIGLTGVGVSWQHQEWSNENQRWDALYSVNVLTWYTTENRAYYGAALGAFNNLILIGVATPDGKHFAGTFGIGINFNN